ncbi:hypothetical protein CAPTEDRAFT_53144, partial [Capitella teleta]
ITISVGGQTFMTSERTLKKHPDTRLGRLNQSDTAYLKEQGFYFYDRNSDFFSSVLNFYRSGELHLPSNFCLSLVQEEMKFWEIKPENIANCCWVDYAESLRTTKILHQVTNALAVYSFENPNIGDYIKKMWSKIILNMSISRMRKLNIKVFSAGVVGCRVSLCADRCGHSCHDGQCVIQDPHSRLPESAFNQSNITNHKYILFTTTTVKPPLIGLEVGCMAIVTIEVVVKLLTCPTFSDFFKLGFNVVDIISIIPMTISVITGAFPGSAYAAWIGRLAPYNFFALGIIRIIRFSEVTRYFSAMNILILSVIRSIREITLLGVLVVLETVLFAYLIFIAERHNTDDFEDITECLWWAVVTLTTLGYGDAVPISGWGYLVGSICAVMGVLCTGLPIVVIGSEFNTCYSQARSLIKRKQ